MENDQIDILYREEVGSSRIKYSAEIKHAGLNEYRVLTASDWDILENKVASYVAKLNEKWDKVLAKQNVIASQKEADERTRSAIKLLEDIDNILLHTLEVDDSVNWDDLKDHTSFDEPNPEKDLRSKLDSLKYQDPPEMKVYPSKPQESNYEAKLSFLDKIIVSSRDKKIEQSKESYSQAVQRWQQKCYEIDQENEQAQRLYQDEILKIDAKKSSINNEIADKLLEWQKKRIEFDFKKDVRNKKVDELKLKYLSCDPSAVLEYCELVLNKSEYPDFFSKNYELEYNPDSKILIIEYSLPTLEDIPSLNEVRFIKGELKEYHLSDVQVHKMFDSTMYKITLRTIHEIFESDKANAIDFISFNGWVNAINRATGKKNNSCILSIQVPKSEFLEVDLKHVDPKTCFKNFKGVGSSKLSGITPIQPILMINKTDKRFVNHYDVVGAIDSSTNLASMDWEDFEHLIREVFANEFNSNGGEVKVTQASKDGGVDAIAFDPDPIRGGKIVIQAKRYTNTVGVSAVRDLFGTVMNEGATKGILVTTADYGPDAYEFAKGKPITLMSGANLLYLLEKHGFKAKIDIKEAKQELKPRP